MILENFCIKQFFVIAGKLGLRWNTFENVVKKWIEVFEGLGVTDVAVANL
ncbi:MAG: hypothetical protein GF335_01875 [Candidatus Moranbacteria bacterium]|nr:hypothetical protein [Candidatus Moranbacteria bacterium]